MAQRRTPRPAASSARSAGSTTAQQKLAAQRTAAARDRIAQAQKRRRLFVVGGSLLGVLVVIAALVVVKLASGSGELKSGTKATAADAAILRQVSTVPAATLNAVGAGTARSSPSAITAPALTSNGKPEVLYIGAEYCPYCAAERWAVAVALSRFGQLHGVGQTASSPSDVYPSTPTLTFHGATYTSSFIALTARELQSNQVVNGQYAPLDSLTSAQQSVVTKYNAPPYTASNGSIPFIDIGGKYVVSGASYDPGVLKAKTHDQVAAALADPNSAIAKAVDGTANLITAAICATTSQQPAAVCSSTGVTTAAAQLTAKQ